MSGRSFEWRQWILPAGLIAGVIVMIVPVPAGVIDMLLAANIALAVVILLTTLQVRSPSEFSLFPSILLAATLGRLILNISTTRLILSQGTAGSSSAGRIIETFGSYVSGENLVTGAIIFAIIVIVQFVVVTKGSTRVSEVAARFSLDGLPGKQIAIDADLSAGLIDHAEANRRRDALAMQADFYGAMDGASKFVRGDAVAAIVITFVNLIGGLALGLSHGMGLSRAIDVFTRLTIGEGLACQIPAFLVSIATGVLLTRNNQPLNLSATFLRQLFGRPIVLVMAAVCLSLLALTRLPPVPLLSLAAICGLTVIVQTRAKPADSSDAKNSAPDSSSPEEHDFRVEDLLRVDPLEIQIGVNLLPLADPRRGGDLLQRISAVRNEIALELGLILPKVRVRDDFSLSADAYRIKICQFEVAQGSLLVERLLVQGDNLNQPDLDGIPFNPFAPEQGLWVEPAQAEVARSHGCAVISAAAVLAQHLKFAAKHHADQLLTRDATQHLIDLVRRTAPAAVDDLIPNQLRVSDVQQILQSLLREGVSIRRLALILETLGDSAGQTKDIGLLGEAVRQRLAPAICRAVSDSTGTVHAARLPPALEAQLAGRDAVWTAEEVAGLVDAARNAVEPLLANGRLPVVLVAQEIRARVKRSTSATFPDLIVLGSAEVGGQNVALAKSPAAAA